MAGAPGLRRTWLARYCLPAPGPPGVCTVGLWAHAQGLARHGHHSLPTKDVRTNKRLVPGQSRWDVLEDRDKLPEPFEQ